jgi:hypothetical protein
MYMAHLKEFRPKLYRELDRKGELEAAALKAQVDAKDMLATLMDRGVDPSEAQKQAERTYILLPDEKEVPDLTKSPYSAP